MTKSKVHDLNDVLVLARDLVHDLVVRSELHAVIIDDAEDLPLVGLGFLHLLAATGPDRFLLMDDDGGVRGSDTLAAADGAVGACLAADRGPSTAATCCAWPRG